MFVATVTEDMSKQSGWWLGITFVVLTMNSALCQTVPEHNVRPEGLKLTLYQICIFMLDYDYTHTSKSSKGPNPNEMSCGVRGLYMLYILIFRYFNVSMLCCPQGWEKGAVFINGLNLGRYWSIGPQQTLYLPGPFLNSGINQVQLCTNPALTSEMVWYNGKQAYLVSFPEKIDAIVMSWDYTTVSLA